MHSTISFAATALFLASTVLSAPQQYDRHTLKPTTTSLKSVKTSSTAVPSYSKPPATCASPLAAPDKGLFEDLVLARSAVERSKLLGDTDQVFSFADPCRNSPELGVTSGEGGKTVRADRATFPSLVSQGGSMTLGFLDACGFNTPHVHPRAAEMNIVVEGRLFGSVTAENGVVHRSHTLNKFDMTVFPQGAIHTEFNPDCVPAVFVAAFPDEDPGVGQIAQNYFGLEDEIIRASAGGDVNVNGADIEAFRGKIPANIVKGVESCLKKCGIQKR